MNWAVTLTAVLATAIGASGCRGRATKPASTAAPVAPTATAVPQAEATVASKAASEAAETPPRPLRRCFPEQPSWVDAAVGTLLDRAADLYEAADFTGALACAEEAARQAPRSVEAHHNRAIAFVRLERMDEARDALALALALGPDDPETLEAAADLHINQLPPSADRSALGLE